MVWYRIVMNFCPCRAVWNYICKAFKCAHDHITNPLLYTQPVTIVSECQWYYYYYFLYPSSQLFWVLALLRMYLKMACVGSVESYTILATVQMKETSVICVASKGMIIPNALNLNREVSTNCIVLVIILSFLKDTFLDNLVLGWQFHLLNPILHILQTGILSILLTFLHIHPVRRAPLPLNTLYLWTPPPDRRHHSHIEDHLLMQ